MVFSQVGEIAEGWTGFVEAVVRADGTDRRVLARKRLNARYRADEAFVAAFLEQARIAATLSHPNLIKVIDAGQDDEGPYVLMELFDGVAARDLISWSEERGAGVPKQVAIRIVRDAARALQVIHQATGPDGRALGLLHRNLSSQNIIVGHEGAVVVTDVGTGKALAGGDVTGAGFIRGNKGYLAPEQLRLQPLDPRTDLFALGVVAWELLCGERLYPNREGSDGPRGILHVKPTPLSEVRQSAPPELATLVDSLLAADRDQRPPSAEDVANRLDTVLAGLVAKVGTQSIEEFMGKHFGNVRHSQQADLARNLERLGISVEDTNIRMVTPERPSRRQRERSKGRDGSRDSRSGSRDSRSSSRDSKRERSHRGRDGRGSPFPPASRLQRILTWVGLGLLSAVAAVMAIYGTRNPNQMVKPAMRQIPAPGKVREAWAGAFHTCGVEGGTLYCWGKNADGQLGVGGALDAWSRRPVATIDEPLSSVAPGLAHSCACTKDGQAYCWGRNNEGQLGLGVPTVAGKQTPSILPTLSDCIHIAAGAYHSCVVRRTGTVACWGRNDKGQLGQTPSPSLAHPAPVSELTDVAQVAASGDADGGDFSCARQGSGAVWCWGDNSRGQLGDGGKVSRFRPAKVVGITDAIELDLGDRYACVLRRSGQVACWGANHAGMLGDGTRQDRALPVEVAGIADAVQLAVGGGHACALDGTGELRCWGDNKVGQLGNGTQEASLSPVQVVDVDRFLFATAGQAHTCGRHATGLVCWGASENGQLGSGASKPRLRPTTAPGFRY